MNTRQLLERRAQLVKELREAQDAADANSDGGMTAEQTAAFDALKAALVDLEAAMNRRALIEEAERRMAGTAIGGATSRMEVRAFAETPSPLPQTFDGRVLRSQDGSRVPVLEHRHRLTDFLPPGESRAAELGLGGFLRALYSGPQTELERRVLGEAAIGSGGAFVPTPLSAEVIDLLRAKAVSFLAGARTIPMTSQTLRFARITADPVGAWRAENAPIVVSDPAFDGPTLSAKSWALVVLLSRELLEDAQNLDEAIRNAFARVAALALDHAILWGDGTGNSPVGIVHTPGIQTISLGVNGAGLTNWQPILDGVQALETANVTDISALIMAPRTARDVNGWVDSLGQPLRPVPRIENIQRLVTSAASIAETQGTATAASSIILGDFSQVFVGMRTALQITVLNERYADSGQVGFVLWMRADVALAHPQALVRIAGIVP